MLFRSAEAGVPDYEGVAWQAIATPGGMAPDVVNAINAAMRDVLASRDVKAKIEEMAMIPLDGSSPAALDTFLRAEITAWGEVVRRAGIAGTQ